MKNLSQSDLLQLMDGKIESHEAETRSELHSIMEIIKQGDNELEARTIEEDIKVIDAVRADMKELEKHLSERIRDIEIKLGRWIQTTDSNQDRIGMLEVGIES